MKMLLLTCFITGVHDDGYGNGSAKVTKSASDPISCFTFMSKYFLVRCQDNQACDTSVTCGTPGRAALCPGTQRDNNVRSGAKHLRIHGYVSRPFWMM